MDTLLIILVLVVVGVTVAVLIARRKEPNRPPHQQMDQDTAWNDPITSAEPPSDETPKP